MRLYRIVARLLAFVPVSLYPVLGAIAGLGGYLFSSELRRVVRSAQEVATPQVSRLKLECGTLAAYSSYARYWVEAFALPSLSVAQLSERTEFEGLENLELAIEEGRGVIVIMPHLGNWDWGAAWMAPRTPPITAVVERLGSPDVAEWFFRYRSEYGITPLFMDEATPVRLLAVLARGEILVLAADRDISGSGMNVPFLSSHQRIPLGPALLALRSGAPVVTGGAYFTRTGHRIEFGPALVPSEYTGEGFRDRLHTLTEEIAKRLSAAIEKAPHQWHMFQPLSE